MRTLWENITKVHKGFGKQYRFDIDDKYLSTQGNLNGGMHVPIVRVDLVFKEVWPNTSSLFMKMTEMKQITNINVTDMY